MAWFEEMGRDVQSDLHRFRARPTKANRDNLRSTLLQLREGIAEVLLETEERYRPCSMCGCTPCESPAACRAQARYEAKG